jgi:rod shape determining protein RodA
VTGGGLFGQGWGRGRLTRLRRLPESYADFIFAVIAEEWGLARTAALVGFFMLLLVLIAQVAWSSNDAFGRLLAGGILATFGFQMLLHMAVSVRLAPITGVTLPLVSYGGSSLVSTLAGLGLVASIQMRREHEFVGTLPTR